jgi:hypothetical protein
MATGLDAYFDSLKSEVPDFSPRPYYQPEGDSLMFYSRNEPSYAKRINSLLTLFLSSNDNSLVGCEVKGVQRMLRIAGDFGVLVADRKLRLGFFLAFALVPPPDDPAIDQYQDEIKRFEDVELDAGELVPA